MIDAFEFYRNYSGHTISDLKILLTHLKNVTTHRVFLAGDSSLDNKHWLFGEHKYKHSKLDSPNFTADSVWQYEGLFHPSRCVKDITYWINRLSFSKLGAINCAVEATTLGHREFKLLDQDRFIRENISRDDVLVVSVGGNDIALRPTAATIICMALLIMMPA